MVIASSNGMVYAKKGQTREFPALAFHTRVTKLSATPVSHQYKRLFSVMNHF
jgi:hypothetical protein